MKRNTALLAALLTLTVLPAAPAAGFNWGLGVEAGYNYFIMSSDYTLDNTSYFGWPMHLFSLEEELVLPAGGGLRLSFTGDSPAHELWLGTAFGYFSMEDHSKQCLGLSANYQYNWTRSGGFMPFVTAGPGLMRGAYSGGSTDWSATTWVLGVGAGVARKMGSGRLRADVRLEQVGEGTIEIDGSEHVYIPKGTNIALRLGFDLFAK